MFAWHKDVFVKIFAFSDCATYVCLARKVIWGRKSERKEEKDAKFM